MSGMTDNQMIQLLASKLDAAVLAAGYLDGDGLPFPVVQLDQPTQQGTPTEAAVFFQDISCVHYGWPLTTKVYDEASTNFVYAEVQLVEHTFQISGLVKQDPSDVNRPTAKDVVSYMKMYVGSTYVAQELQAANGVGTLRVTNVSNPAFEDDSHQYEYRPSFDITFSYRKIINFIVPSTNVVKGATVEGFKGEGTFPVLP